MENFKEAGFEFLKVLMYTMVTVVVPIAYVELRKWVKANVESKLNQVKNDNLKFALEELYTVVDTAVDSTTQTYVESLKKSGEFTEEAQETAKKLAIDEALKNLSEGSKKVLESTHTNLESYIDDIIQSLITKNKN